MGEPGFWDDQEAAAKIATEHARVARRLERYEQLIRDYDDARELHALDGGMEAEIARSLEPLQRELDRLEEDALFTGEYDAGDAVVTIHSGAGGTDSQDWAEMLLRMYLRWAANRGFQTEVLEASPGEEAGRPAVAAAPGPAPEPPPRPAGGRWRPPRPASPANGEARRSGSAVRRCPTGSATCLWRGSAGSPGAAGRRPPGSPRRDWPPVP